MKVFLTGTGSPIPDANRAGPSTLVQSCGQNILVDCGRGVAMRLVAIGVMPQMLSAILITHLHSDHITDLNDLITTRWILGTTDDTTPIYGPPGTRQVVEDLKKMLQLDEKYRLAHHRDLRIGNGMVTEVTEVLPGDEFQLGDVRVIVGKTDHQPVNPTVGYRLEGEGKSVVLAGDTVPCLELDELCRDADIYVQSVLRPDLVRLVAQFVPSLAERSNDILNYHSSVQDAAETATRAGVKNLMLTHYVPSIQPGQEDEWRKIAAQHFSGPIVLGQDLTSLEV